MPKGIKSFQKKHKQFNTGKTHFKKGYTPWNKGIHMWENRKHPRGTLGKTAWNKGLKTGLIPRTAFKKGNKFGELNKGNIPWNKLEFRIPYPYEFNEGLKEQIRQRDNYECRLCGTNQEELNEKLIVHHINFDKNNNFAFNLISLCRSCHGKVHCANNIIWMNFFQNIQIQKINQEVK